MKQGMKSDLVGCLETKNDSAVANTPAIEVKVMDGAAVVHCLPIGNRKPSPNRQRTYSSKTCVFWNWGKYNTGTSFGMYT